MDRTGIVVSDIEPANDSSSLRVYNNDTKDRYSFFLYGLINNFIYVVFLSAAHDIIVGSDNGHVSEGSILLADILPGLMVKFISPYVMHKVSYGFRVWLCSVLSATSLWMVAFVPSFSFQICGIVLASFSSGLGEVSFLALTSYFPSSVVGYWGSGTGAAGIFGSLSYLVLTTWLNVSVKTTLLILSFLPPGMIVTYHLLMSKPHLKRESRRLNTQQVDIDVVDNEVLEGDLPENMKIWQKIQLVKPLLIPFMLPLFTVFWAEYTINQGVSPVLLFPLEQTPFQRLRDHYVTYQCLYQFGVFISRSSIEFIKINNIMLMSILQVVTLFVLILQGIIGAMFSFIPSVYIIFIIILWEGLLGGAAYVNAFHRISIQIHPSFVEFSMSATALADTLGITFAAITAMFLRPALCEWQINSGSNLCKS